MSICSVNCVFLPPAQAADPCASPRKKGGWSNLIVVPCGATLPSDPCDATEWETLVNSGQMRMSKELLGSKAVGSVTKARTSSCKPEEVVSGVKTFSFRDFNTNSGRTEFDFWNYILRNQGNLKVAFLDCNGDFYGWYEFGIEVDTNVPDNYNEFATIDGSITVEATEILSPVKLSSDVLALLGLSTSLDVATQLPVDDTPIDCDYIQLGIDAANKSIAATAGGAAVAFNITQTVAGTCTTPIPVANYLISPSTTGFAFVFGGVATPQPATVQVDGAVTPGEYVFFIDATTSGCPVSGTYFKVVVS